MREDMTYEQKIEVLISTLNKLTLPDFKAGLLESFIQIEGPIPDEYADAVRNALKQDEEG